jgi:bacitracin synthase 1
MNEDFNNKGDALTESHIQKIREELAQHLPAYLIPAYFKQIDKIPLTLNGKVDRRVLPEPGITAAVDYQAPGSEMEKKMVGLWAEVLNMEKESISVDADFFQLGGHSLNAFVLVSKIFKVFNVKIPLIDFFKMPVLNELIAYINRAEVKKYTAVKPVEKRDYYMLSPAQKRMYILNKMSTVKTGYNLPQVIFLRENIEPDRLEQAAAALIARHDGLRTSFLIVENEPVQKIHEQVNFSIQPIKEVKPVNSGTGDDISAAAEKILTDFVKPFDLSQAPILRAGLIQTGGLVNVILFDSHHIISDGTSQEILEKEFLTLYNGETLPALKLQYRDFVGWQQSKEQQELKNRQEKYWLDKFSQDLPVLNLPYDYSRPLTQSFAGASVGIMLNEQETAALKQRAAEHETTLFMFLLAVFNILLAKVCGQEDIVVGADTAGRNQEELHSIIGMFVNVLPLRNFPAGRKTFRDFLKEVKEGTLAAFENVDYQFEDLVDKISVNRDISRNPVFDVVFSMQNQTEFKADAGNMDEEEGLVHKKGTAKFDLNLAVVDIGKNLYIAFEYCSELFKPETIDRIIFYFKNIIHTVSANPGIEIMEIEIVSSSESAQLLKTLRSKKAKASLNKEKKDKTKQGNFEADFNF